MPAGAGTPSHRAGCRGGDAARNRAADGTAEADADGEAPGKPRAWPRAHQAALTPEKHPHATSRRSPPRPGRVRLRRLSRKWPRDGSRQASEVRDITCLIDDKRDISLPAD